MRKPLIRQPAIANPSSSLVLIPAALLLVASLLSRPINHDEGQYVAAIAQMRDGLPYRDFAFLQTPLQPLLLSPLSLLTVGWLLLASRMASALFAWLALTLLIVGLRGRTPAWAAMVAASALACTEVFLFAGSLARNDALPMAFLAGALALLLQAPRLGTWNYAAAGFLLGLAASAKINFALPAAGAALFVLWDGQRLGWRASASCAAGGLLGLAPTLVLWAVAPAQFVFGVFTYGLEAPQQWWAAVGEGDSLTPFVKLAKLLKYAAMGPMLLALICAALDRRRSPSLLLLDLAILGGLIAAYLPDPSFRQYLAPLVPPLFLRFALTLGNLEEPRRKILLFLTAAACIAGLVPTVSRTIKSLRHGSELGQLIAQGPRIARLAAGATIVTLSPERIAGSDVNLDRGFVTGPFLFRTHGELAERALRLGYSPNWQRLEALDSSRPGAILVGGEGKARPPLHPGGLDVYLANWARSRGYRQVSLGGGFTLFLKTPRVEN